MIVSAGFTAPLDGEGAVDDVQIVEVVRLAVHVQHRGVRIGAKPAGAVLVRNAAEWIRPGYTPAAERDDRGSRWP